MSLHPAPVSACLIVRDAAATLGACLESLRPYVTEVCVYDTGSSDGTLALLEREAAAPGATLVVERGEWRDDFAWAREQSFALASEPWRIYVDADDILCGGGGLAALVAAADGADARGIAVAYNHHDGPGGRPAWLWTNRILRRDSGRWEGVVHELWRGLRLEEIAVAHPACLHVQHLRRREERQRYLGLVVQAARDPTRTPRGLMMLGFERLRRDDAGAVRALEAYLAGGWDTIEGEPNGFRWIVLDQLVQAQARLGNEPQARRYAQIRDGYTAELSAAIAAGLIENVEYWRDLLAGMDALLSAEPAEPLLPGPLAGSDRPASDAFSESA